MALKNFSNIKRLFIVEDENKQSGNKKDDKKSKENSKKNKQTSESNVSWKSSAASTSDGTISSDFSGKYSQQIFESLTKAIAEANLPGEDYLEFIQGLKAMKDLPMEESLKLKSVFMTLTTKGLTVPKIIESANHYLSVLEQEKNKFYEAIAGQKKTKVESKQKLILDLETKSKEKAELIKKLTNEIAANNQIIEKETKEIHDVETKIKSTENDFLFTYTKVTNQITDNITKIKEIQS